MDPPLSPTATATVAKPVTFPPQAAVVAMPPLSNPRPGELDPLIKTPESSRSSEGKAFVSPAAIPSFRKAETQYNWGPPAGLPIRSVHDEHLRIYRMAIGINAHLHHERHYGQGGSSESSSSSLGRGCSPPFSNPYNTVRDLEAGRRSSTGVYAEVVRHTRHRRWQHHSLSFFLYCLYFGQVLVGAALTALGPSAKSHPISITFLGACNTVMAGVLALIKGQGLVERLRNNEVELRRLRDWIEETEALLATGVIGRDREEVGVLVEATFRKYNAAKQSEDDNQPEAYVSARVPDDEADRIRRPKDI